MRYFTLNPKLYEKSIRYDSSNFVLFMHSPILLLLKKNMGGSDFMEITIGGKTYRNEIYSGGSGFGGQTGCGTKSYFRAYMSQFEQAGFFFDSNIMVYENAVDFKSSKAGSYNISGGYGCNLDLILSLEDKTKSFFSLKLVPPVVSSPPCVGSSFSTNLYLYFIIVLVFLIHLLL